MRKEKHLRTTNTSMEIRESSSDEMVIEGYFALFNDETNLFGNVYEEIDRDAFNNTLDKDIRALINHDTSKVLGRTKAKTLELRADEKGLYGKIKINPNDTEAVNLYERVKRGDVDQCSFGFFIKDEDVENRSDGTTKFVIKDIDLFEVSAVTFPAYENTGISAREKQVENLNKRKIELWKKEMREKINVKNTNA